VGGVAYWFHAQQAQNVAALMVDDERVTYNTALAKPDENRSVVHALFNF
jgi:hypothetical protein